MRIDAPERSRQAMAVGNAITRLHREHYGRGATTTRTVYQRNHIVSFLEDIYTPSSARSSKPATTRTSSTRGRFSRWR